MNILQVNKYYLHSKSNDRKNKSAYSPLEKSFKKLTKIIENQGEIQTNPLEFSNFSSRINGLKQAESIFSDNHLTNLIKDRSKEILETQRFININDLNHCLIKNNYSFSNYSLPTIF